MIENDVRTIPIFPLPNVVFFPRTQLPLHIFEPRYRQLTKDCLNGDRILGVVMLKNGWERNYYDSPDCFKMLGIGRIVEHEELPDGLYNIVLQGLCRARILTELQQRPYRLAQVQILREDFKQYERDEILDEVRQLRKNCRRLAEAIPQYAELMEKICSKSSRPALFVDLIANHFVLESYDRQSLLSELNILRRLRLVRVQIKEILSRCTPQATSEGVDIEP
ncbi:MAG: LON peptidase substrate-binding domain-containing protein [bacterium]